MASSITEVLFENRDGFATIDEGVLVDFNGGAEVFDSHSLGAAHDEILAKDDRGTLSDGDALI